MKKLSAMFLGTVVFLWASVVLAQPNPLRLPFQGSENWGITCYYEMKYYGEPDPEGCWAHTDTDEFALDFNLPGSQDCGKPIVAVASGSVVFAGWRTGYGQCVDIDHGDGYISRYAHLNSIAVSVGQFVLQGATLGTCGDTGTAMGCHLHFVLYLNGSSVLPEPMSDYTDFHSCNISYQGDTPPGCYYSDNHYPEFTALLPFNVSKTAGTSQHAYNPDVAMLTTGEAYVVWWYSSGGNSFVYSSVCNPDANPTSPNTCSSPIAISETSGGGAPSVAIDSQDNIHLVYQKGSPSKIYYTKFNGATWSSSSCISDPLTYGNNRARIALDSFGNPRVVWWNDGASGTYRSYHIYYNEHNGNNWIGPQQLTYSFGNNGYSIYPDIAVDPSDISHVVFERPQWDFYVYYMFGSGVKENWSTPQAISDPVKSANRPSIAAGADGVVHATFVEQALYRRAQVVYRKNTGSGWQTTETVSQTTCGAGQPDIGVDYFGNPHFDWLDCSQGGGRVFYRRKAPTGWQGIRVITTSSAPNAFGPTIEVDRAGRSHAAWMEAVLPTGAWDIFYRW